MFLEMDRRAERFLESVFHNFKTASTEETSSRGAPAAAPGPAASAVSHPTMDAANKITVLIQSLMESFWPVFGVLNFAPWNAASLSKTANAHWLRKFCASTCVKALSPLQHEVDALEAQPWARVLDPGYRLPEKIMRAIKKTVDNLRKLSHDLKEQEQPARWSPFSSDKNPFEFFSWFTPSGGRASVSSVGEDHATPDAHRHGPPSAVVTANKMTKLHLLHLLARIEFLLFFKGPCPTYGHLVPAEGFIHPSKSADPNAEFLLCIPQIDASPSMVGHHWVHLASWPDNRALYALAEKHRFQEYGENNSSWIGEQKQKTLPDLDKFLEQSMHRHQRQRALRMTTNSRSRAAGETTSPLLQKCSAAAPAGSESQELRTSDEADELIDYIIDVGANIGSVALYFAARGYHVIAVEPLPSNVAYLKASLAANRLEDRVKVVQAALSSSNASGGAVTRQGGTTREKMSSKEDEDDPPFVFLEDPKDPGIGVLVDKALHEKFLTNVTYDAQQDVYRRVKRWTVEDLDQAVFGGKPLSREEAEKVVAEFDSGERESLNPFQRPLKVHSLLLAGEADERGTSAVSEGNHTAGEAPSGAAASSRNRTTSSLAVRRLDEVVETVLAEDERTRKAEKLCATAAAPADGHGDNSTAAEGAGAHSGVAHDRVDQGLIRQPADRHRPPIFRLLKIDTEGHDTEVLEGARKFLAKNKPVLFVEHNVLNAQVKRQRDPGVQTDRFFQALSAVSGRSAEDDDGALRREAVREEGKVGVEVAMQKQDHVANAIEDFGIYEEMFDNTVGQNSEHVVMSPDGQSFTRISTFDKLMLETPQKLPSRSLSIATAADTEEPAQTGGANPQHNKHQALGLAIQTDEITQKLELDTVLATDCVWKNAQNDPRAQVRKIDVAETTTTPTAARTTSSTKGKRNPLQQAVVACANQCVRKVHDGFHCWQVTTINENRDSTDKKSFSCTLLPRSACAGGLVRKEEVVIADRDRKSSEDSGTTTSGENAPAQRKDDDHHQHLHTSHEDPAAPAFKVVKYPGGTWRYMRSEEETKKLDKLHRLWDPVMPVLDCPLTALQARTDFDLLDDVGVVLDNVAVAGTIGGDLVVWP
ncbi:unnamed protein product [Amoebophrya sp. A120]|nr:unnamed protein product [Amoebophrya sp. A120]|eukprot:GSA120T00008140001.1